MQIRVNSDKNISVDTKVIHFIEGELSRGLKRYAGRLTRVEVHLSDVNSHKFGTHDKRCLIEARPARHRALVASTGAATVREAVAGALTKLRSSLRTFFGRLEKQHEHTSVTPMGLRRSPETRDASSTSAAAHGIGRANARSTKRSPVAAKKRAGATSATRAASTKKAIYQARRKSWPAR